MYRVNQLPRKVLIVPDEVIAWGPTADKVDARNILTSIQIAEDRFIRPLIGKDFYNDFRDKKNVVVTDLNKDYLESLFEARTVLEVNSFVNSIDFCDTWYQTIWNEHLWKLISECVIYVGTPTNWSRYSATGELVNNPKNIADNGSASNSVDLADIKWKMDKILMDRIDPMIAALQDYLNDNAGYFPFYKSSSPAYNYGNTYDSNGDPNDYNNQLQSGVSFQRKTPWVFVYDRIRNNC